MALRKGTLTVAGTNSSGFAVNITALTPLLPGQGVLSLESGIGELEARLEKRERKSASGRLDLVADDVVLKREEIPLQGDLEVHASLTEGDLATGTFDVSGSTIRLDDIAQSGSSEKQQGKLEPWYGHLEIEEGILTFGSPMTMNGHVRLAMEDTRPVLIVLRKFTNEMKWLNLTRNVKQLDGTMDLGFGAGYLTVDNLDLAGEGVEILGWFHIRDQIKDGRLFARHGVRAVGFAFDRGEGRLVTRKPRRWFDEQQASPPTGGSPGPSSPELRATTAAMAPTPSSTARISTARSIVPVIAKPSLISSSLINLADSSSTSSGMASLTRILRFCVLAPPRFWNMPCNWLAISSMPGGVMISTPRLADTSNSISLSSSSPASNLRSIFWRVEACRSSSSGWWV